MEDGQGTCFVIMGFGKKTDFETGRTLDLDKSYRHAIKPAVEMAGLKCVRADEMLHSGWIDEPNFKQLLEADLVVADLSTRPAGTFYELGVRHALRPHATIIVAEEGMRHLPIELNQAIVLRYQHLGENLGYEEVIRFREALTHAIMSVLTSGERERVDSPIYAQLRGLVPPRLEAVVEPVAGVLNFVSESPTLSTSFASEMSAAVTAIEMGNFEEARLLLERLLHIHGGILLEQFNSQLLQRLAFATFMSRQPTEQQALEDARRILMPLDPQTSNDTETLRLWGEIHSKLWRLSGDALHIDESVRALKRAFHLRSDYASGVEYAFALNARASCAARPEEAIADFVLAQRVRQEVLGTCNRWLETDAQATDGVRLDPYVHYSIVAALAEAKVGLAHEDAQAAIETASLAAPSATLAEASQERIEQLRTWLALSPLKHLRAA